MEAMANGNDMDKNLEEKRNYFAGDAVRKRIMKETEEDDKETWAAVVSRRKRNGAEMEKGRTEQQSTQGRGTLDSSSLC
ncbi:hypothetical protein ROHU_025947 [Labeo rohita]|uniref:Uncharacterized protein n=1 Tax=Labeo rohita TaxID=84645 RepID=A0A498MHR3_LABRO|nr:hypothetical protein ROHU_025947 [Labeo rohita]